MKNILAEIWRKKSELRSGLITMLIGIFIFIYSFQAPLTLGRIHHNLPMIIRFAACALFLWGLTQTLTVFFPSLHQFQIKRIGRNRVSLPRDGMVYLLMMTVLFVGSILSRENMLMLVFAMMTGPFVLNGWITYSMLKNIKLKRLIPNRVMVGEIFTAEITLENNKRLIAAYLMEVSDFFTNRDEKLNASIVFRRVGPRQKLSAHYHAKLMRRGIYQFGPLQVSTKYPLGFVKRGAVFAEYAEIIVHPQIGKLSSHWSDDYFAVTEMTQQSQSRRGVFSDEFNHIREYRTGDSQRAIHWRSSARQGELMVREYHQNRNYDLIVGIDLWSPTFPDKEQAERVEWAISFVGTICREHLKYSRDTKLTFISQGKSLEQMEIGIGSMGLEYLLDFLTTLQSGKAQTTDEFIKNIAQVSSPRSRTVMVTTRKENASNKKNYLLQMFEEQEIEMNGQWRAIEADPTLLSRWLVLEDH